MEQQEQHYIVKSIGFHYTIVHRATGYSDPIRIWQKVKFVRISDGSCIWHINGKDHEVKKGDVLVFCQHDQRYIKEVTSKQDLLIEDIRFSNITLYPMQHCIDFLYHRSPDFCNIVPKENPYYDKILEDFSAIDHEAKNNYPWKNESISNKIVSIAINLSRIYAEGGEKGTSLRTPQYDTVCKAIAYVQNNLGNDLSREAIAKALYISPSYLSHIFKEYNGTTLQDYIVTVRVENAVRLIKSGYRPIDAAFESGFTSSSGFYRAFAAVTGCQPKDFV